jgi:hypothetical protein
MESSGLCVSISEPALTADTMQRAEAKAAPIMVNAPIRRDHAASGIISPSPPPIIMKNRLRKITRVVIIPQTPSVSSELLMLFSFPLVLDIETGSANPRKRSIPSNIIINWDTCSVINISPVRKPLNIIRTPIRLSAVPQTDTPSLSTDAEALIVEPCTKHQAAAIMLAEIVIAAGKKASIFNTS